MKAASVSEIKQVLKAKSSADLMELCLRLIRYKKENKELLTYLLFEADDIDAYISSIKAEMDEAFETVHKTNLYFAKKTLRKILRVATKYVRYTGSDTVEAELFIYFCTKLKASGIPYKKSTALVNIYNAQLKKAKEAIAGLHEDLQYEYLGQVQSLDKI
ncbi:MAG TPA: hypothetical protein VM935_12630 [Chitinophagaceae bacterium]|nr:hypothetical protein [Chitinophagaceae bacterium]